MSIEYPWSKYQLEIFEEVLNGKGHLAVSAKAGCAKSSTALGCLHRLPPFSNYIFLMFANRIKEEMQAKLPPGEEKNAMTTHSLGYRAILKAFNYKTKLDGKKTSNLLEQEFPGKEASIREMRKDLEEAIKFAKINLVSKPEEITQILHKYDLDDIELIDDSESVEEIVWRYMEKTKSITSAVDYVDQIWFPNVHPKVKLDTYDYVFVDEYQDLNKAQVQMATKLLHKTSRLLCFYDENQQIFSFAGADLTGIDYLVNTLGAKKMPLPISYRCAKAIVKEAQKFVPDIEAAVGAPEGFVKTINEQQMRELAKPGCFILSRVNAPLVGLAMEFIAKKIPCNVQGRKIGDKLLSIVKKSRTKSIEKFLVYLKKWADKQVQKLVDENQDLTSTLDNIECLQVLCNGCKSIEELTKTINNLFQDKDDSEKIILGTIHSCKGMERKTVFVLKWTLRNGEDEEIRLQYVAATRAKEELYYVTKSRKETKEEKEKTRLLKKIGLLDFDEELNVRIDDGDVEVEHPKTKRVISTFEQDWDEFLVENEVDKQ